MKKTIKILFLSTAVLPFFSCGDPAVVLDGSYAVYGTTAIVAGMAFPPFANARQIDFTIREIKKLAIDRIRIAIDWRNREPLQGSFNWAPLDQRMHAARENGIAVFLTIASVGPDWARLPPGTDGACMLDEDALRTFIEAVLVRYTIDKIQFGNEWEAGSEDGTVYTDPRSIEKFVTYTNILFDAVQRLSPETKVVLGGLTKAFPLVEYFVKNGTYPDFSGISLAQGITVEDLQNRLDTIKADYDRKGIKQNIDYVFQQARYDMIDMHLYDDPENWPEYLTMLPAGKPIVVSEFGGPNSEFENTRPDYQAARMPYYIDAIEALPITEAYYFKLVESNASYHQDSGLFFSALRMKPARNVFARRLSPKE